MRSRDNGSSSTTSKRRSLADMTGFHGHAQANGGAARLMVQRQCVVRAIRRVETAPRQGQTAACAKHSRRPRARIAYLQLQTVAGDARRDVDLTRVRVRG